MTIKVFLQNPIQCFEWDFFIKKQLHQFYLGKQLFVFRQIFLCRLGKIYVVFYFLFM